MTAPAYADQAADTSVNDQATVEEETVDLTDFNAALDAVDPESAKDSKNELVKTVRRAYTALSRLGKTEARNQVKDDAQKAVMDGHLEKAQKLFLIQNTGLKVLAATTAKPKDNTTKSAERVLGIQLAYSLAYTAAQADETVDDAKFAELVSQTDADRAESEARARVYVDWLKGGQEGDEPEASAVEKAGARLSLGRGPGGQGRKPASASANAEIPTAPEEGSESE